MKEYREFLDSKQRRAEACGFTPRSLPPRMFDWQRWVTTRACERGRFAIFADCGLTKTLLQLAWARSVYDHTGLPQLILAPLAVGRQTEQEAADFSVEGARYVREPSLDPIQITNYEMLDRFDPGVYGGVVLDESSILKSYMGKTKQALIEMFRETPYRLCCTATPAPNDVMEIGNHAEFLGVLKSSEMLSRWFINDTMNMGKYRLKGHAEEDFWMWVASWAVMFMRPSDIGGSDEGFVLPPLDVSQEIIEVDPTDSTDGALFRLPAINATDLFKELRRTVTQRASRAAELVRAEPDEQWVIWCNTNAESEAITALLSDIGAVEVRGSQSPAVKESRLLAFTRGEINVLVTKPTIAGFGVNWQHCARTIFLGLSFSYEQFYQAVRRLWRFGQKREVKAYLVIAETEGPVLATVLRKEKDQAETRIAMVAAMKGKQMEDAKIGWDNRRSEVGDGWEMINSDSVLELQRMPDQSVGFTIFSPPFSSLYIYSDALADMGNSADDEEFLRHFEMMLPDLLRATIEGRLCAVHCKDLPKYRGRDGAQGLRDFPGDLIRIFEGAGWSFHSRVTIWKCPVTEMERTKTNGLLYKTIKRDSSQSRQGMADYMLVFRRPPSESNLSAKPITHADGSLEFAGDPEQDPRTYPGHPSPFARTEMREGSEGLQLWRRYAEPVWWDINQTRVLNIQAARDAKDEKHICPLQLDVIARSLALWSSPGDVVFSPFAGIGSEGYEAIRMGRRFLGVELKESYFRQACKNLKSAVLASTQSSLFEETPEGAIT